MDAIPFAPAVNDAADILSCDPYEAPAIETVLTPEEMAREVQYAGRPISGF